MPTEPLRTILDRDLSKAIGKPTIEIAVPLLRELVNDATHVFARCHNSVKSKQDEDVPILFSYLHIIQMADAIEALLAEGCSAAAVLPLRSSFEALLAIRYILDADSKRRSSAYMVAYCHRRIRMYKLLDSDTKEGSDFIEDLSTDEALGQIDIANLKQEAKKGIQNLGNLIKKERNTDAEAEYQRLKSKRGREPEWYQLFGGPPNLRGLARRLNYRARYDFLYRSWSNIAHAVDLSRFITRTGNGKSAINPIRNTDNLATTASFAAWVMLEAKKLVLAKFRPGEEASFKGWYLAEIRGKYLTLCKPH
jgi:hypothetical protein